MNLEEKIELREKIKSLSYYIVIGFISIISLIIIPMLGSNTDVIWPHTFSEWAQWATTRASIVVCNILFFVCFQMQAKVNIEKDPRFIEANTILEKVTEKNEYKPRSPKQWKISTYSKKAVTLTITSIISTVTLSNTIINFDLTTFLADLFTVSIGLVFGFIAMKNAEIYWTEEYNMYAKNKMKEIMEEENDPNKQQECTKLATTSREEQG